MGDRTVNCQGPATVHVTLASTEQAYVTVSLADGVDPYSASKAAYELIAEVLTSDNLHIVHERVFGSISACREALEARDRVISSSGLSHVGPPSYIQGRPCWGDGLAGICIQAVHGGEVRQIYSADGAAAGYAWKQHGAEFLILQNLHGFDGASQDNSPEAQAGRMFDKAAAILQEHGTVYRDVVRTWIYLADILDWYHQFNAARNDRYHRFGIMPDFSAQIDDQPISLPASTGIEGGNPMGAACLMDLLAVTGPSQDRPDIEQMTNIKQEDAFMYGSAFSRGAYVGEQDVATILISGTAAIDEQGQSLYPDDVQGQILRTFDNVETLIGKKGASLKDICEANVFFKRAEDVDVFRRLAAERGLEDMPAVCINADVCRDDLLFEMDGVAVVPR